MAKPRGPFEPPSLSCQPNLKALDQVQVRDCLQSEVETYTAFVHMTYERTHGTDRSLVPTDDCFLWWATTFPKETLSVVQFASSQHLPVREANTLSQPWYQGKARTSRKETYHRTKQATYVFLGEKDVSLMHFKESSGPVSNRTMCLLTVLEHFFYIQHFVTSLASAACHFCVFADFLWPST